MPDYPEVDPVTRRFVSPKVLGAVTDQLREAGFGGTPMVEVSPGVWEATATAAAPAATADVKGVLQLAGDLTGTASSPQVRPGTTLDAGKVRLATTNEATAGSLDSVGVTPAGLKAALDAYQPPATTSTVNAADVVGLDARIDSRVPPLVQVGSARLKRTVDANNVVTLDEAIYTGDVQFEAYRSAASTSLPASTWTTFPYNVASLNVGGGVWDAANYTYKVPVGGLYLCVGSLRLADQSTVRSVGFGIATTTASGSWTAWADLGGVRACTKYSRVTRFAANDLVRACVYSDGATLATYVDSGGVGLGMSMTLVRLAP